MQARSSVWIVLVWWSVAACSAARAESSGFGMLSLAPSRRDPGVYEDVADTDYVVFAAGTRRVVARGRIFGHAARVKVPAGRYELELRLLEERPLHTPILLGPVDVPANEIVGLIPEFALGSLLTLAMQGGSTVRRSYSLYDAAGTSILSLSTDDSKAPSPLPVSTLSTNSSTMLPPSPRLTNVHVSTDAQFALTESGTPSAFCVPRKGAEGAVIDSGS
jgi:hypothetical protein